jgi:class 3 adenylate cyclase
MAVPAAGLALLVAQPEVDVRWEHHLSHLWLVLAAALISLGLALLINREAARRNDARLFLVSMTFAMPAAFFGLHALATPGVLGERSMTGFVLSTPTGLLIGAFFAVASSMHLSPDGAARVMRLRNGIRLLAASTVAVWALVSLIRIPSIESGASSPDAYRPLISLMAIACAMYFAAAFRYYTLHRRRPSVLLVSLMTAFALLGEAAVAVVYGRSWKLSWWEWHLLLLLAFAFVAYSAWVQFIREGRAGALFGAVGLEETVRHLREEYSAALEALVDATERAEEDGTGVDRAAAALGDRFDLSEGQVAVLARSADALAHERETIRHQGALVAASQEAHVIRTEEEVLRATLARAQESFLRDELRIALIFDGRLDLEGAGEDAGRAAVAELVPVENANIMALPLIVKGKAAGVLHVRRRRGDFADRDRFLLRALAGQLSITLENARLYTQLDGLFRSYISPDVATSLLADPDQAKLGGDIAEVTVLMADLRGFTTFSERTTPDQVVAMLNTYFGLVVPIVLREGGTVIQFVGDALMAIFNAPTRQVDHAARAARAGLETQAVTTSLADERDGWPRFRVGINTGIALVGNIGAEQMRNFTAIGDTTNLAARLESSAPEGAVVVSQATLDLLGDGAEVESMGALELKGKAEPVQAYRLLSLRS